MGKNTLLRAALDYKMTKPEGEEAEAKYKEYAGEWKDRPDLKILKD